MWLPQELESANGPIPLFAARKALPAQAAGVPALRGIVPATEADVHRATVIGNLAVQRHVTTEGSYRPASVDL